MRDLGGHRTVDGRTLRFGRLYRSEVIDKATASTVDLIVDRLRIQTYLDLRTAEEIRLRPVCREILRNVDYLKLPLKWRADFNDIAARAPATVASALQALKPAVATVIKIASDDDRTPMLIACSAGKDRTGFLAAILLKILSIPEDTIVKDYLASSAALPYGPKTLTGPARRNVARKLFGTDVAALMLGTNDYYGGFQSYLAHIGIARNELRRFRKMMIG